MYGWPALRRDLVREGGLTEKELGAVFLAGSWSVNGCRLFSGLARDRFGTRVTACGVLLLCLVGVLLVAFSSSGSFWGLFFGMLLLGVGSGCQLCVQPVTALFREASSTAMATLSGAFQISGVVFLWLSAMSTAGAGRSGAYGFHACCVAVLFALSAAFLPSGGTFARRKKNYEPGGAGEKEGGGDDVEKNGDLAPASAASATAATTGGLTLAKIELVNRDEKRAAPRDDASDDASDASDASDAPSPSPSAPASPGRGRARRELMTSGEYILLLAWFSVIMPPMQYYIMSIGYQLERKGDDDGLYTSLFALLYGLAAALAPPAGMIADRFGVGVGQGVATSTLAISFLILLSPSLPAQVVGMAFYSVGRLFVFAMYFSNLGRRFGFEHYGALAGTGMLCASISSLLQYPMFTAAVDGGTEGENAVNAGCAAAVAAVFPYTAWLAARERRKLL